MKPWIYCGAHVTLISENGKRNDVEGVSFPVMGEVYTIRSIFDDRGDVCIRLVEIINPLHPNGVEYGFNSANFAPVSTIDTTNTVAALNRLTTGVKEDA